MYILAIPRSHQNGFSSLAFCPSMGYAHYVRPSHDRPDASILESLPHNEEDADTGRKSHEDDRYAL